MMLLFATVPVTATALRRIGSFVDPGKLRSDLFNQRICPRHFNNIARGGVEVKSMTSRSFGGKSEIIEPLKKNSCLQPKKTGLRPLLLMKGMDDTSKSQWIVEIVDLYERPLIRYA